MRYFRHAVVTGGAGFLGSHLCDRLIANGTRVTYTVNTEGGSSGAPCFNTDWELVALHHSGDPNFDPDHKPEYNEGIPIAAIVALLTERGKQNQLG